MLNQYSDIMSVPEAAEVLSVGKNRIYELLENKALKGFKIGRVWKIPKDALQEYILAQCHIK